MVVQQINDSRLMIYMEGEELEQLPSDPRELTADQASGILKAALGPTYDPSWDSACFELFLGRDTLLLFALQHSGAPSYFTYKSIEQIIAAAAAAPPGIVSYLTHIDDTYLLIVYPPDGCRPTPVLGEFGTALSRHAFYALHVYEHGTIIDGPTALDTLREAFIG